MLRFTPVLSEVEVMNTFNSTTIIGKEISHMRILTTLTTLTLLCSLMIPVWSTAGNISPTDKYAWSETGGWTNLSPEWWGGVTVYPDHLEGFAWLENIGWIKLGSHSGGGTHTFSNSDNTNWGVNRSGSVLSGYAWSENAGWINFKPTGGGVNINTNTGQLSGHAWAENLGWIRFKGHTVNAETYYVSYILNKSLIVALNGYGSASGTSLLGQPFNCSANPGDFTSPPYSASKLCTDSFIDGDQINLTGTPATNFNFSGWSVDCAGTGGCLATMTADHNVTARFSSSTSKALLQDSASYSTQGYVSPAAAYTGAGGYAYPSFIIQAQAATFNDDFPLISGVTVRFIGGFDDSFNTNTGMTTIKGPVMVRSGKLIVDRLAIKTPGSSKDITEFSILGVVGTITGTNISLTLPFGTDLTNLVPTITITGATVSPTNGAAQNFSSPVSYIVTAEDGSGSTQNYTVTVSLSAPTGLSNTPPNFNRATITWTAATEAVSYQIFRNGGAVPIGTSTVATFTDTTAMQDGVAFSYEVRAIDPRGHPSLKSTALTVVLAPAAPPKPLVESQVQQIYIHWGYPSPGVTEYQVFRQPSYGGMISFIAATTATNYTDTTTSAGEDYVYSISAVNAGGSRLSAASDPVRNLENFLYSVAVIPSSLVAGATGDVSVSFMSTFLWPVDGKLVIDFPAGFDLSGTSTVATDASADGTFAVDTLGQSLTVTRSGGSNSLETVNITLSGIKNPLIPGVTGSFELLIYHGVIILVSYGTAPGVTIIE